MDLALSDEYSQKGNILQGQSQIESKLSFIIMDDEDDDETSLDEYDQQSNYTDGEALYNKQTADTDMKLENRRESLGKYEERIGRKLSIRKSTKFIIDPKLAQN